MADQNTDPEFQQQNQVQFLLSDFNTRLGDLEERNRLIRERVLLLGQNLISSKQEEDEEIRNLKKQTSELKKETEKLKTISKNILEEIDKFVKRDEILIIERMLKDFQPLEFARIKDVEAMIKQSLKSKTTKQIKTKESTK